MKGILEQLWQLQELDQRIFELWDCRVAASDVQSKEKVALGQLQEQEVTAALREIKNQRAGILSQVPPKYLALYQRIADARGGVAVAAVSGKSCGACNMLLPAQFVIELSWSKTVEQCPSCKRILVSQAMKELKL